MRRLNLFSREMTYECSLPTSLEAFLAGYESDLIWINEKYFYVYKVISAKKVYLRKHGKPYESAIIIITAKENFLHIRTRVDRRAIYSFGLLMIVWLSIPWIFEAEKIKIPMLYIVLGLSLSMTLILINTVWEDFKSIQVTLERLFKKEDIAFKK